MKIVHILLVTTFLISSGCVDKKEQKKLERIPVEENNGIGDGAPPLDSVLKAEKNKDTLIPKEDL
ncbi:MAG: hypothetical protein CMC08_00115 [Flavobacteriaceae bacterium]|nr:hypothetical protein [Flavobacteriaceae bacterium]